MVDGTYATENRSEATGGGAEASGDGAVGTRGGAEGSMGDADCVEDGTEGIKGCVGGT